MCGLVGIGLKTGIERTPEEMAGVKEMVTALLQVAEMRGGHATGVAVVTADSKWEVVKAGIPAPMFIDTIPYRRLELPTNTTFILGHTRYGTGGSAENNWNNHPLVGDGKEPVIVTHNGVIANDCKLAKQYGLKMRWEVDSEILVRMAEAARDKNNGIDIEVFSGLCAAVEGSVAMAAIDPLHPTKLTLARDSRSVLTVAANKALGLVAWASTQLILDWALGKPGWRSEPMPKSRIGIVDLDREWRFSMSPFDTKAAIYRKSRSSSYLSEYQQALAVNF